MAGARIHLLAARRVGASIQAVVLAFHLCVDYSCGTAPDSHRASPFKPYLSGWAPRLCNSLFCWNGNQYNTRDSRLPNRGSDAGGASDRPPGAQRSSSWSFGTDRTTRSPSTRAIWSGIA